MGEEVELSEEEARKARRRNTRAARKAKERAALAAENEPPVEPDTFGGIPDPAKLKEDLWRAFAELGGVDGLVDWGRRFPKEFYPLWARLCIPKEGVGRDSGSGDLESMLAAIGESDE